MPNSRRQHSLTLRRTVQCNFCTRLFYSSYNTYLFPMSILSATARHRGHTARAISAKPSPTKRWGQQMQMISTISTDKSSLTILNRPKERSLFFCLVAY